MGGAKCCAARRRADAVADPHVEPTQPGDLARDDPISPHHRAALEHFDAGDLGLVAPELQALAIVESTGEHPDIGELFAARAALDLEHGAAGRTFDIADRGRQQLDEGREQRLDAGPGDGRAHEYRVDEAGAALPLQCAVQAVMGQAAVVDIGGQHGLVMLGQPLGEPLAKASIVGTERDEGGGSGAEPLPHAHRHDIGRQPPGDRRQHPVGVGAGPIELVDEDQRGDAEPLQRPHQHAGLPLHALDRRDHQHGAIEHVQHALDLGDEIGVAGRIDQVDGHVMGDERHHGGLDGDAALALQRHRIGLGIAAIDAPEAVDDTGCVKQPFSQRCLTGVDMRQNPKVQCSHCASRSQVGEGLLSR